MSNELFDLSGRVGLITGSGRGIGFVLARGLARAGARVVLNDIDAPVVEAAAARLRDDGLDARAKSFDVTDSAAVDAAVAEIEAEMGSIDILLNNAGIQRRYPLEEFPEDEWRAVIDLDLTAPFIVARAVAKGMIARKSGKIVNTCSLMSAATRPTIAAYTAAKGGLAMLTKSMAADWAVHNIQANGIGPGYFKTEMTKRLWEDAEFDGWLCKRVPAGRWGDPEELVGTVVFLSSPASDYVNGHVVYIDGGMLATI